MLKNSIGIVGIVLINISPSNIFKSLLLLERYHSNCQTAFGRFENKWVNELLILFIIHHS